MLDVDNQIELTEMTRGFDDSTWFVKHFFTTLAAKHTSFKLLLRKIKF